MHDDEGLFCKTGTLWEKAKIVEPKKTLYRPNLNSALGGWAAHLAGLSPDRWRWELGRRQQRRGGGPGACGRSGVGQRERPRRVCSISSRTEAEEAHDKALLDQKQDATPAREMAGALRQGEARLRRSQQGAARARDPAGPRPRRQRRMEAR